jgi:hypothetical protein
MSEFCKTGANGKTRAVPLDDPMSNGEISNDFFE